MGSWDKNIRWMFLPKAQAVKWLIILTLKLLFLDFSVNSPIEIDGANLRAVISG